jgi:hypothetical protein
MTAIPFVLLVAKKVKGRPFGEVAVTGIMSDLPAGTVTLLSGSITGEAKPGSTDNSAANTHWKTTRPLIQQNIFTTKNLAANLAQKAAEVKFFS